MKLDAHPSTSFGCLVKLVRCITVALCPTQEGLLKRVFQVALATYLGSEAPSSKGGGFWASGAFKWFKTKPPKTAGFSPGVHLPGFRLGYLFLTLQPNGAVLPREVVVSSAKTTRTQRSMPALRAWSPEVRACFFPRVPLQRFPKGSQLPERVARSPNSARLPTFLGGGFKFLY